MYSWIDLILGMEIVSKIDTSNNATIHTFKLIISKLERFLRKEYFKWNNQVGKGGRSWGWGQLARKLRVFFLTFYFVVGYSQLTMLWCLRWTVKGLTGYILTGGWIYTYPSFAKLTSHPSCQFHSSGFLIPSTTLLGESVGTICFFSHQQISSHRH